MGHQLAQRLQPLRGGRADDRADVATAPGATPPAPSSPTSAAMRSLTVPPDLQPQLLDVGRAGVRGPHEHEQPAAASARAARQTAISESLPSSGLTVSASTPRPGDRPNGGRRLAEEGLPVGSGGDVDVSPLGVGDDEQAALPCVARSTSASAAQPGAPEALEARDLQLDRDAVLGRRPRSPAGSGARPATSGAGLRRGGRSAGPARTLERARPQPRGIRIEPQDDL